MSMIDLITKKRFGGELTIDELEWMLNEYIAGRIPDYQMSAFLMAVCFSGCTARETADLTMAMAHSGDMLDLSAIPGIKVDKHSTGGVADTTTLIVAPMVAACGLPVVKMSGRGLGHTGGTLDKLESVPGVNTDVGISAFLQLASKNGIAVVGQSGDLVPADKQIYALRDVTATVDSIPLIASSIMSKKIAAGCDAIVLDVKVGNGAFMKTEAEARELAKAMVDIGAEVGRHTVAVLTDMNQPLGRAIGNALEIEEAADALSGKISMDDPLMQVSMLLAKRMYMLGVPGADEAEAQAKLSAALNDGRALGKLALLLTSLGGDGEAAVKGDCLPKAREIIPVKAQAAGTVSRIDALSLGKAALLLGAGRETKADVIDPAVGVMMRARLGDALEAGGVIAELHVNDDKNLETAREMVSRAVTIGDEPAQAGKLVYGVIER